MRTIVIRHIPDSRRAYAVQRMNLAAQRMLRAETVAEEIWAGHWVLAWAVAAGARPAARAAGQAHAPHLVHLH